MLCEASYTDLEADVNTLRFELELIQQNAAPPSQK